VTSRPLATELESVTSKVFLKFHKSIRTEGSHAQLP